VDGILALFAKKLCEREWQLVVDEPLHDARTTRASL
jgi:hypothetical protein